MSDSERISCVESLRVDQPCKLKIEKKLVFSLQNSLVRGMNRKSMILQKITSYKQEIIQPITNKINKKHKMDSPILLWKKWFNRDLNLLSLQVATKEIVHEWVNMTNENMVKP